MTPDKQNRVRQRTDSVRLLLFQDNRQPDGCGSKPVGIPSRLSDWEFYYLFSLLNIYSVNSNSIQTNYSTSPGLHVWKVIDLFHCQQNQILLSTWFHIFILMTTNKLGGQHFRKLGYGLYDIKMAGEILQRQVSCSRRLSIYHKRKINFVFTLFKSSRPSTVRLIRCFWTLVFSE
jgi:hypothetical protein